MNVALRARMSRDDFFVWAQRQEAPYEFDGFQPVAMTGGTLGHSFLQGSINQQLRTRLAGKPCRSLGPDAGVATVGGAVRYPDAVVTCSKFDGADLLVPEPIVVFEVISPTSGRRDRVTKLREYQAVPSIRRYVILEVNAVSVTVLSRDAGDGAFTAAGLSHGDTLDLPECGIGIPIDAIYAGTAAAEHQDVAPWPSSDQPDRA